jgi:hypothetical protein
VVGDKDERDDEEFDEDEEEENLDEDEMPDIGGDTMIGDLDDNDGDDDELIRAASKPDPDEAARKREVRRRLEEFAERRKQDLDDTFNFNFDDDL